jgi:hypothetical protein
MNGLQCPRLLWHAEKKLLPEIDLSKSHLFSAGHEFEEYVKLLYPKGIDATNKDFLANIKNTKSFIEQKRIVFEAGFMVGDLYVRCDLLKPSKDGWDLFEIKSTTQVKPVHVDDLAFQKFVLEKWGLKINRLFVIYLNKDYVKKGKINPKKLVKKEEVTEKVMEISGFEERVQEFLKIMRLPKYNEYHISRNCNSPYECPLKKDCWSTLPENHVLQLTNWRVYWQLFEDGIVDLKDVPVDTKLNEKETTIIASLKENPQINKVEIKKFLSKLEYPLYHFDFETFDTTIPLFDKTKPYQKIPFQYSLHLEQKNGKVEHKEFLSEGGDPRIELLKQMKSDLKGKGNIITFNKSFEISVLRQLAKDFPKNKKWIYKVLDRIIDLAEPFQKFYYYNKSQKGSYSIKKVLPAITGKSYSELEINNGADASMLYFYTHIKPNKELNKKQVRKNLLQYCGLDTEGMVWIINELKKI